MPGARCPRAPVGLGRARRPPLPHHSGAAVLPSRDRVDPDPAGRLPLPRRPWAGDLRRQGEEPASPALVVLPGRRQPAPAHRDHGHQCRRGGLDRRQHRGRGAAARVLLDQGVRPPLQRQVPRRQVLPLARGHRRRGVPAGDGRARRQAQGHPLLRPLQPRLGDPRDRRRAAARLPDALVQQRCLQAVVADRAALPARLHRQVLGALRRRGERRGAPADRRRLLRVHGRAHPPVRQAHRDRRCTPLPTSSTSSAPPGCATTSVPSTAPWRSRPWCSATAPTPT